MTFKRESEGGFHLNHHIIYAFIALFTMNTAAWLALPLDEVCRSGMLGIVPILYVQLSTLASRRFRLVPLIVYGRRLVPGLAACTVPCAIKQQIPSKVEEFGIESHERLMIQSSRRRLDGRHVQADELYACCLPFLLVPCNFTTVVLVMSFLKWFTWGGF